MFTKQLIAATIASIVLVSGSAFAAETAKEKCEKNHAGNKVGIEKCLAGKTHVKK